MSPIAAAQKRHNIDLATIGESRKIVFSAILGRHSTPQERLVNPRCDSGNRSCFN
jgi:hypothetical protein